MSRFSNLMCRSDNILINAIYRLHTMLHYFSVIRLYPLAFNILLHVIDSLLILNNLDTILLKLAENFTVV